ncbi:restriction endonuclease subunit S [Synechococcus sp. ATX 2A4]|uniref:restriction endonuclease subunit S n=1 Tax=Synechococcus sp. ATX 2A4 TaxID=2823727 RepID=UPI0020CC49D3|nr:restriction endonuclease subunit S [Synechococcus sp. ATX 2A4]
MREGWQIKKVSEIAKHSLGKMLDKAKNKGEPKPYLRNLNVRWFDFDLSDVLKMPFLPMEVEKYTAVKGDVLICEGGYPGRAAIWEQDEPIYFQKALHRVRFHEPERNKWFIYYLLSKDLDGTLKNHFNGAGIQHFTGEALAQFPVPLPPLPEQHRIVALLDEAFAGLAIAKANAVQNLQNARAIFESHLQSVFSERGEGWVEKELCEVCTLINGRAYKKDEMLSAGPYPLLRVGNFFSNRDWYYSDLELEADKYCDKGDLLYAWSASFGPRIWDGDKVIYHYHIWKVLPKKTIVEKRFLLYLLEWDVDQIKLAHGTGTTMMHVSKGSMESRVVPIPPLHLQSGIVSKLDSLREETQRLTRLYERKLAALEELKKSLLHQAFNGEL